MISENQPLRQILGDAILLTQNLEREFRSLSREGDDEDVQSFFLEQADLSADESQYFLNCASGEVESQSDLGEFVTQIPLALATARISEERLLQGLIATYTALSAKRALLITLNQTASNANETELAQVAESAAGKATEASGRAFHFIPTRSKIAYNMLTVDEADPAIDTKMADNRIS